MNDEGGAGMSNTTQPVSSNATQFMGGVTHAHTERRLQLERSLDQWWLAFEKQEYSKSDGLATALEQFVNKHYDEVVSDLKASSPRFRRVAAAGLGFSGKKEAVEPLIVTLRDNDVGVLPAALLSLRQLAINGVDVPSAPVIGLLSQRNPDVRNNASMVLAHAVKKGEGELYLPLTSAMEDKEPGVRLHIAAALGRLGDPAAIPFLTKALNDEFALVRVRSALALARIGDKRAVPSLIEAVDDPQPDVSRAAHKALQSLTGRKLDRRKEAWDEYLSNKSQE